jgi:hypothetical protein
LNIPPDAFDAGILLEPGLDRAVSVGDFDGDGTEDLVFYRAGGDRVILRPGPVRAGAQTLVGASTLELIYPLHSYLRDVLGVDLNGDGKNDLVAVGQGAAYVIFGRASPPARIDLGATPPDMKITGCGTFSYTLTGDFNGDGFGDLVYFDLNAGNWRAYRLDGRPQLPAETNLSDSATLTSFEYVSPYTAAGDVDGDGRDEFIVSRVNASPRGRTGAGETYVVWGSTIPWGAPLRKEVTIAGPTLHTGWHIVAAADADADGRQDLIFEDLSPNTSPVNRLLLIGDSLSPGVSAVDLQSGNVDSGTVIQLSTMANTGAKELVFDFDGDGATDVVTMGETSALWVSRGRKDFSHLLGSPAGRIPEGVSAVGCFNRDAFDDVAVLSGPALSIVFGHRPFAGATITASSRAPGSPWIDAALAVAEGDPTEMRFSGDVADPSPGTWMPFAANQRIRLDSALGTKSLSVVFRNALGRESDPAALVLDLSADGAPGVRVVRNRLRDGASASWETALPTGGRLRATVRDAGGRVIATPVDATLSPGIWPVTWDGRASDGQRAAPGRYRVRIDYEGGRSDVDVVVEK